MHSIVDSIRLDKTVIYVTSLGEQAPDRQHWARKTPEERLAGMEYLRVLNYGQDATSARLQRLLAVTELGGS